MMVSFRYYVICFVVVLVLTLLICWVRQTRTRPEFFWVMGMVAGSMLALGLILAGLAKLLVWLGVAESGFIL